MYPKQRQVVVGGGLAGVFLALRLLERGQEVWLFDAGDPNSASRVAAGLFNVITGRFGAKTWMAEHLLPTWKKFLDTPAYSPFRPHVHYVPIYRPFKEIAEYNKWLSRAHDPAFEGLVEFREQPLRPDLLHNPHGGILITPCGWTDIGGLIEAMHLWLQQHPHCHFSHKSLSTSEIDLSQRKFSTPKGWESFDQLIFCEGHRLSQNSFFPGLPLLPNKGEILEIEAPDLNFDWVLSRKIYLLPKGGGRFVVGSTYNNHFDDPGPSDKGKEEICQHLEQAIKVPYRILDHRAGIRPTTPDRKPILGTHPHHDFLHVFSGFGTKGVLLAPFFSEVMAEYLLRPGSGLHPAVSLQRFYKKLTL